MIRQLRKRHLQIWYCLAFLLPSGIFLAWMAIQNQPVNDLLQPVVTASFPKLIRSVEKDKFSMNLKCTENESNCQLEYINRSALTVPSLLIYLMKPGAATIDGHELLGRIESMGVYHFSLPAEVGNKATGFILYDFIHRKILDSITFSQTLP